MRECGLLVKKRKRVKMTTFSNHWLRKHPNLIKNKSIYRPNQVWVSDITYIQTREDYLYLSLVTDAYSRKIIGHWLSESLDKKGPIKALKQALSQKGKLGVTHHSDRGIQYCSNEYVALLKDKFIKISMSDKGSPYQNAIAERVNGILKHEMGCNQMFDSLAPARQFVNQAIEKYNSIRPHLSCDYLTPNQAHVKELVLKQHWKNYYRKNVKQYQDYESM